MSALKGLPNIGSNIEKRLNEVGIFTAEDLINTGSETAFIKIKTVDQSACLNMLLALEGAVQQKRWHHLNENRKTELKEYYRLLSLLKKD
ncbi:MAG: TfoX/Sxy family protein [Bacteroidales bacterium]|nr:TfoX/Sxy family protein [Bacteroidales bacterium]